MPTIKNIIDKNYAVVLASASPRRAEILRQLDIPFKIKPYPGQEPQIKKYSLSKLREITLLKTGISMTQRCIIIACDTIVVYNKTALGKPRNTAECTDFLKLLSGRKHKVISGLAIKVQADQKEKIYFSHAETIVEFEQLSEEIINWYISTREWQDKAGGYAIQGMGRVLVKSIQGCYYNVVGLPISVLQQLLRKTERGI